MQINSTNIDGVFEIQNKRIEDDRGFFVKIFHSELFKKHRLDCDFKESYYSVSNKGVLRGMHFQLPPHDHEKLVYVTDGEILDVALDIRTESPTYGKYYSTQLSSDNAKSLYMGKGFAHGFLTLSDTATVVYLVTTVYAPDFDTGIHWNSFGLDWGVDEPALSERDKSFKKLK